MISADDNDSGWPQYVAWTITVAFGTAIATKLGEWGVEVVREKVKARGGKPNPPEEPK